MLSLGGRAFGVSLGSNLPQDPVMALWARIVALEQSTYGSLYMCLSMQNSPTQVADMRTLQGLGKATDPCHSDPCMGHLLVCQNLYLQTS